MMNCKSWVVVLLLSSVGLSSFLHAECNYRLAGDLNIDCRVDLGDLAVISSQWLIDCQSNPLFSGCSCDIPWVAEPPMTIARDQFAGGVIDGKIYVFGGNGNPDGMNLNSTEVYDPASGLWSPLADNTHNNNGWGVEELNSAVVNGKLYVFGAYGGIAPDGYYGVINFNEAYDPATDTWTTLAQKPTNTSAGGIAVYNDEIYLLGGYFDSDNPSQGHEDYTVVECYNPVTNTWRFVTNMPKVLTNFGIAVVGSKAYLFGGFDPISFELSEQVITYDFETDTWTTGGYEPLPVAKGYGYSSSVPVIAGKVYLAGGVVFDGERLLLDKQVDIYDPVANTFEQGTPLPLALDSHVTVQMDGRIYLLGGCSNWDFENRSKAAVISYNTRYCEPDYDQLWSMMLLTSGDEPQWIGWNYGQYLSAEPQSTVAYSRFSSMEGSHENIEMPTNPVVILNVDPNGIVTGLDSDFHGAFSMNHWLTAGTMTGDGGGYGLGVYMQKTAGAQQSDLMGTWNYYGLVSGDAPEQTPGWYRGSYTFDAGGNFVSATPITDSTGISYTPSISLVVNADSTVTTNDPIEFKGTINSGRNIIAGVGTFCPGSENGVCGYNLIVMVKDDPATTYTQSDFAGTWSVHALLSGDAPQYLGWMHHIYEVDVSGYGHSLESLRSNGSTIPGPEFNFSIDSGGFITAAEVPDMHGFLASDKDLFVMTQTDGGGASDLLIGVKIDP
jgi:N-acetylneuraminic acid mutarotase